MFYQLFNRESSKTTAKPSRVRVSQHVTAKKVAVGQHSLTPDRLARITASAKQREYRERQKNFPRQEIDSAATVDATEQEQQDTVAPLHDLSGKQSLANSKPCGDSHIPDGATCHIGETARAASEKAGQSEKPEDHRAAAEAHVRAAMEFQKRRDNKPSSPETRADATRIGHHQGEAKRHDDAAAKMERDIAHAKKLVSGRTPEEDERRAKAIAKAQYGNTSEDRLGICVEAVNKLNNRFSVPSDGWIHLAPFGSHPHPTGVVQQIDAKSVDAMVANFASRKANDKNFTGALLDFDHFSQSGDKPSEAGGWIENLAKREDGMWGQVRWTDVGEKAVNGGRYRLVSPVWLKRNCETLDNGNLRPLVLDSVALTNEPNLKGLTPISR